MIKQKGIINLGYEIELVSGLHIGGIKGGIKIGGVDNPTIKYRTDDGREIPYIPGSSIKGKTRHLMEKMEGKTLSRDNDFVHSCSEEACNVCNIFGRSAQDITENTIPRRAIFTDAYLVDEGREYLEVKPENVIKRDTSKATPRFIERVTRGARFKGNVIFNVYTGEDVKLLRELMDHMKLLEYVGLGGNVSRGYGQIKLTFDKYEIKIKDAELKNAFEGIIDESRDNNIQSQ